MKIDIEDIKALEPGKVYVISLSVESPEVADAAATSLSEIAEDCGIKFIFLAKGYAELISAPVGIEINSADVGAYQLMEEEMIAYLEKTYSKDDAPPEMLLVTELRRIFRYNKDYGAKHCEAFSSPRKWPEEVTEDQLLSIVQKWENVIQIKAGGIMEVVIGNTRFEITFDKQQDLHRDGTEKINTICSIRCGDEVHGVGVARQNYKDEYDEVVGKRVALTRAMKYGGFWYFGRPWESKTRRTVVWNVFNSRFRG